MPAPFYAVLAYVAATVIGGWAYFRRFQVTRPPVGIVNLRDVVILMAFIVLVPYLYLNLPLPVVSLLLGLAVLAMLYLTLEPLLRGRAALWVACAALISADVWLALSRGATSAPFLLLNNAVMVLLVVGATNLWAQSAMQARDVALLAAMLTVFDLIATSQLSLMTDMLNRLEEMPFVPVVAWGIDVQDQGLRVGLGDLLLATVFPLTMRKAFGRAAGVAAVVAGLAVIAAALALLAAGVISDTIPVMVPLGPLMVAQYGLWRWRHRSAERTLWQYLQAEPLARQR